MCAEQERYRGKKRRAGCKETKRESQNKGKMVVYETRVDVSEGGKERRDAKRRRLSTGVGEERRQTGKVKTRVKKNKKAVCKRQALMQMKEERKDKMQREGD